MFQCSFLVEGGMIDIRLCPRVPFSNCRVFARCCTLYIFYFQAYALIHPLIVLLKWTLKRGKMEIQWCQIHISNVSIRSKMLHRTTGPGNQGPGLCYSGSGSVRIRPQTMLFPSVRGCHSLLVYTSSCQMVHLKQIGCIIPKYLHQQLKSHSFS